MCVERVSPFLFARQEKQWSETASHYVGAEIKDSVKDVDIKIRDSCKKGVKISIIRSPSVRLVPQLFATDRRLSLRFSTADPPEGVQIQTVCYTS